MMGNRQIEDLMQELDQVEKQTMAKEKVLKEKYNRLHYLEEKVKPRIFTDSSFLFTLKMAMDVI